MNPYVECPQCEVEFRLSPDELDAIINRQPRTCGKSISEDEQHDSDLVGTQPKCRECLEKLGLPAN